MTLLAAPRTVVVNPAACHASRALATVMPTRFGTVAQAGVGVGCGVGVGVGVGFGVGVGVRLGVGFGVGVADFAVGVGLGPTWRSRRGVGAAEAAGSIP